MKNIIIFSALALIGIWSCKSETSNSIKKSGKSEVEKTAPKPIPAGHKYLMLMADFDTRLEASKGSKSHLKLIKNTVVKSLNQYSDLEEELLVNKRNHKAPYEKVKVLMTGEETWVFGGALKSIYTGTEDVSDTEKFQSFAALASELDPMKLESGKQILDALKANVSDDVSTNDGMFFMTYDFVNRLARSSRAHQSLIDNHSWTLDDYNEIMTRSMDMNYHSVGKVLNENGLTLDGSLGEIIVASNIDVIDEILNDKLSPQIKEYIELIKLSWKSKVFDNDNIIVPLTSVVNQANKWTQFGVDNPGFAHAANISMKGDRLMEALLNGTKNTPAFDHESRIAKSKYRVIWDYVLKHYSDTPMGEKVREHTEWLESRDWKFPVEQHVH